MAGQGIFADVSINPIADIYGNSINLQSKIPNIGASNAYNSNSSVGIISLQKKVNIFSISENPVRSSLNISFANAFAEKEIKIYSVSGKLISSTKVNSGNNKKQIELAENVNNGIYFVRVSEESKYQVLRFVLYKESR